jgi:hypothetical protein
MQPISLVGKLIAANTDSVTVINQKGATVTWAANLESLSKLRELQVKPEYVSLLFSYSPLNPFTTENPPKDVIVTVSDGPGCNCISFDAAGECDGCNKGSCISVGGRRLTCQLVADTGTGWYCGCK